jgi:Zn-dependent peptidase ImmA (M78 family)
VTLPRGFKAQAERDALRYRKELGLADTDPLDPHALAHHMEVAVVSADALVARERLEEIERLQAFAFSAATFDIRDRTVIVTNPLRTAGRLASDLAHELSHLIREHDLTEVREINGIPFRTCQPDQEEEATALGSTILLPRPLLMRAAIRGDGPDQIAQRCGVTLEMARFRFNATGVAKQAQRRSS